MLRCTGVSHNKIHHVLSTVYPYIGLLVIDSTHAFVSGTQERVHVVGKLLRILIEEAMTAVGIDDQLTVRDFLLEVEAVDSRKHVIILDPEEISNKPQVAQTKSS